jgi:DNA mismatch repair protein MutS
MYILDFMACHNSKYLVNLSIPKIIKDSNNLVLELNTLSQLSILPTTINETAGRFNSVFDVINHTITAIGRRHLKNILSKPFKDINIIQKRYNLTEELNNLDFIYIEKILCKILDFERLHRKMDLQGLHPYEFPKLNHSYMSILELITFLFNHNKDKNLCAITSEIPNKNILSDLNEYIDDYKKTFNLDLMKNIALNTSKEEIKNFFNTGVVIELDKIQTDIESLETDLENLRQKYDIIINDKKSDRNQMVKLNFTDNDGYYFVCTKIRYQKIIKECKDTNFTMRATSNTCKFSTDEVLKISNKLITTRDLLVKKVKLNYLLKLSEYSSKYKDVFTNLKSFIEIIDISLSNLKCSKKYRYCKPIIYDINSKEGPNSLRTQNSAGHSFIQAEALRHPIIELISDTEYIPNDISLDNDKLGILLYGLNSSGKSSLLRALGISIILAQCGLYVPCKSFQFAPFSTLISQVDLSDNLFSGKSSFITEMCGLKKILSCASKNTLVLSDELCRGTEVVSSSAIVSTTILKLIELNTKFFFTTHLHDLPKIQSIKTINAIGKIEICHLNVNTNGDDIIFERNLLPGSGSELYGLEVCKSIIQDNLFIETAFEIRNDISGNKTSILNFKKSRYNKQKIIDSCEVCGYTPTKNSLPLDTHHINEQRNCDENGFVNDKHFHKNRVFNLVSLCKTCHLKIDTGELVIKGYKQSTSGKYLDLDY